MTRARGLPPPALAGTTRTRLLCEAQARLSRAAPRMELGGLATEHSVQGGVRHLRRVHHGTMMFLIGDSYSALTARMFPTNRFASGSFPRARAGGRSLGTWVLSMPSVTSAQHLGPACREGRSRGTLPRTRQAWQGAGWEGPGRGSARGRATRQMLCACPHTWPQIPQGGHYLSSGLKYLQCRLQGNI